MSRIGQHIAGALDPVVLARAIGMECDPWQADVLRNPHRRELIVASRQAGKTATAAVAAVHKAIYEPGSLVVIVSPSLHQSQRLFKVVLALYRSLGRPVSSESENQLSITLENSSEVVAISGDPTTGRGLSAVALLVIDEAAFVLDELFDAMMPVLAVSKGRMLAISTPNGRQGWYYHASKSPDWNKTIITADQCPRISDETIEEARRSRGEQYVRREFFCDFADIAGMMFASAKIDLMFAPARLGAIEPGALFGNARPEKAIAPRPLSAPLRPVRCRRSRDGHFWKDAHCIHCGIEQPALASVSA